MRSDEWLEWTVLELAPWRPAQEPGVMGVNAGSVRVGKLERNSQLCSKEFDFSQRKVWPLHPWSYLCLGQRFTTLDFSIYVVAVNSLKVGAGHPKSHGTSGPGDEN